MPRPSIRLAIDLVLLLALPAAAQQPSLAEIRALVEENLAATQAEDLEGILATVHPQSPGQAAIPDALESLRPYNLAYEASSIDFITMEDEYALVRVIQRTTRIDGPDFLDNELDGIWALKREGKEWKYWSQMILGIRPVGRPSAP